MNVAARKMKSNSGTTHDLDALLLEAGRRSQRMGEGRIHQSRYQSERVGEHIVTRRTDGKPPANKE